MAHRIDWRAIINIMSPPSSSSSAAAAECADGACARKSEMFTAMRDAMRAHGGGDIAAAAACPLDIESLGTHSWGLVRVTNACVRGHRED